MLGGWDCWHHRSWLTPQLAYLGGKPREVATNTHIQSGGSSLNGLKTFNPGRRKSLSLPVAIVRP